MLLFKYFWCNFPTIFHVSPFSRLRFTNIFSWNLTFSRAFLLPLINSGLVLFYSTFLTTIVLQLFLFNKILNKFQQNISTFWRFVLFCGWAALKGYQTLKRRGIVWKVKENFSVSGKEVNFLESISQRYDISIFINLLNLWNSCVHSILRNSGKRDYKSYHRELYFMKFFVWL